MTMPRLSLILLLSCVLPSAVQPAFAQVTAADVRDRPSLRAFVERAAAHATASVSEDEAAYAFFDRTFRPEGAWKQDAIYLFVIQPDGLNLFHGANQSLEGQDLSDLEDKNGVRIVEELIRVANEGGGFVEYLFDNPDVLGDEEDGSSKVSYATLLTIGGTPLIIGSGFYPADAVPLAPPLAQLLLAALLVGGGAYRCGRPR